MEIRREEDTFALHVATERFRWYYTQRSHDLESWYHTAMPRFLGDGSELSLDLTFPIEKNNGDAFFARIREGEKAELSLEEDGPPVLVRTYHPVYPPELAADGVEGTVLIEFVLAPDATMHRMRVVSSPHPAFSKAALESIIHWRYIPARKDGRLVPSIAQQPIVFAP